MSEEGNKHINVEDADSFEISSEDISTNDLNKSINNNDCVKDENTNTIELKEDSKIEKFDFSKKICPQCKNECSNEDLFCNKCGYKFEELEASKEPQLFCPQCGNEYTLEDLFCKKCGLELDQTSKCPYCGSKYETGDVFCGECGKKIPELTIMDKIMYSPHIIPTQYGPIPPINNNNNYTDSNTATCRFCKSNIPSGVSKCPHCGEWLEGGSHFGCGSFLMVATIILGVISALGAFSFQVPWLGEVTGAVAIIFVIAVWLYLLPSLIADSRGHESKFGIFLVNLFFGWSVIGWFVALVLAFSGKRR